MIDLMSRKGIFIHLVKGCNLICDLCYARSPFRSTVIKEEEIKMVSEKGHLIPPEVLEKTIDQIPKKYWINFRGGETSLYPDWAKLTRHFAEKGYKIVLDTNGSWIPLILENKSLVNHFYETLEMLAHPNIKVVLSVDKWHEAKDPQIRKRADIFIRAAEEHDVDYLIFNTGLPKTELRDYLKRLNIDPSKVASRPYVYELGRRENDPNAVNYCGHKEDEIMVIAPDGTIYPCLKGFAKKIKGLELGNIYRNSIKKILTLIKEKDFCKNCNYYNY